MGETWHVTRSFLGCRLRELSRLLTFRGRFDKDRASSFLLGSLRASAVKVARHAPFAAPIFDFNSRACVRGGDERRMPAPIPALTNSQTREIRGIDRFCDYPWVYCVILSCARRTQLNGKCKIHQTCQCDAYVYPEPRAAGPF